MMENAETGISEEQSAEEEYTTLGAVLLSARESRGLTIGQIASELRVESRFLTALERDDLELFVAPVFVKGYIKHLAHRYELEYEDLLARYTRQTDVGDAPVTFNEPIRMGGVFYAPWLIGGLILLLGIPALWFIWGSGNPFSGLIPSDQEQPDPPAAEIESSLIDAEEPLEPAVTAAPLSPAVESQDSAAELPDPATEFPDPATEFPDPATEFPDPATEFPDPVAEPAADELFVTGDGTATDATALDAAAARSGQIAMSFEQDCWTEVSDGNGNALYYALGSAGTTLNIDGDFPLSFTLGNPAGVQLSINDRPYPVPAPVGNATTVRFVVSEAP